MNFTAIIEYVGIFAKMFGNRKAVKEQREQERAQENAVTLHLEEFLNTRRGVEAFVEQPTTVTKASILLVAHDGEWTRRQVPCIEWAREFVDYHEIPSYDAGVVGYPQRMRDYNARKKAEQNRQR